MAKVRSLGRSGCARREGGRGDVSTASRASCACSGCPGETAEVVGVLRCGCRVRRGWPTRPARPGSGWRARSRRPGSGAWSRRRARSSARRRTGSRPTAATPSGCVRLLMIGGLHPVRVPSSEEEALRDLVRAREDVRGDLMRARHRLGKLLLRHDVRYDGTGERLDAAPPRLARSASSSASAARRSTLLDYLGAIDALRASAATRSRRRSPSWCPTRRGPQTVARLRCLRGIDTLSAVGLCAEIGDFAALRARRRS